MKKYSISAIFLILLLVVSRGNLYAGTWTLLNMPGASWTDPLGIDNNIIVGQYYASGWHTFSYDGTTWNTLDKPWSYPNSTRIYAIDGGNLVGQYYKNASDGPHGLFYNGATWKTLDAPGATKTYMTGISGNNIVGLYLETSYKSFLYDGTTWTTLVMPGVNANQLVVRGIDGSNIVGWYDKSQAHGFLYDGTTWTTLDMPGATGTWIEDIDGSNIVGHYSTGSTGSGSHSFLYDGTTWTTIDMPGATWTWITGISGKKIVGYSRDVSDNYHGFIYEITEAPVACIAAVNQTIEAQGPFGAVVTLDGSCSSDADSTPGTSDDINDFNWYEIDPCNPDNDIFLGSGETIDCNLPLGEHTIVLEVTDKADASDSNEITVTIQDTTPPELNLSVSPTILWPPNGKMIKITSTCTATDICDPSPQVSLLDITASEPCNPNDIQISDDGSIYLCATRSGNSKARIYTLTYQACDESVNCATKTATVTVPHDMRK